MCPEATVTRFKWDREERREKESEEKEGRRGVRERARMRERETA